MTSTTVRGGHFSKQGSFETTADCCREKKKDGLQEDEKLYILLTVHLGTIRVNNQLDAHFIAFISLLYMFRATQYSSSGE